MAQLSTGTKFQKVQDTNSFYFTRPDGTKMVPAGTVVSLTNNQPVEVALSSFGGAESATSHFKIEKGGNYMIFFDASAMLVKIYRPNTAPWYYSGTYPEALWLHGNLKLETGEINDWGDFRILFADSDEKVDVYTPSGIRLMEGVTRAEALTRLEPGIYLIGSDKVVVK